MPGPACRRLIVLVRHAKAEPTAVHDRDRPLTQRGRDDAAVAGEAVAQALGPYRPGRAVALVSPATRTYETWRAMAARLPADVDAQVPERLYGAGVDDVLDLLGALDHEVSAVVVIGHNPTMHATTHTLAAGGDPDALASLDERGFPTAAVAVLELDGGWSELGPDSCTVASFAVGRG